MLRWLAGKWAVNDPLPSEADLIVIVSYGSTGKRLTKGSAAVLALAKEVAVKFTEAAVGWGIFSKNPDLVTEYEIKSDSLFGFKNLFVGGVSSTTDECETIVMSMKEKNIGTIIVVAEGAHSRRCKRVWQHMLPNSTVYFRSVPAWKAGDSENPMWFMKSWRVWLAVNILADTMAYRWEPILRFLIKKNFSQPTTM